MGEEREVPEEDGENDKPKKEIFKYKDILEYRLALDYPPPDGWVQTRKLGGSRTSQYLPISLIEALADKIFREWYVIEEKPLNTGEGIGFTVKIQALPDYPGADYIFFTGSGAVVFQTDRSSGSIKGNAVEYNFPAARSRAITSAFNQLGNIFGRNIGRTVNSNPVGSGFTLNAKKEEDK